MGKRDRGTDENTGRFVDMSGPPQKRARRVAQPITEASQAEARREWEARREAEEKAREEFNAAQEREAEAEQRAASKIRIDQVLESLRTAGYGTLYQFLEDLFTTKDQHHSSHISQMLIHHGHEFLDLIRRRQPQMVAQWVSGVAGDILTAEGVKLAQRLRPSQGQSVSKTLEDFSLAKILVDAEYIAPTLCYLLRLLANGDPSDPEAGRKDKNLVSSL